MTINPQSVRLGAFLAGLAVFYALETLLPKRRWNAPRPRRLLLHVVLASLNTVLIQLTVAAPLALLVETVRRRGWGLSPILGFTGAGEVLASVVVLDLFDYFWHRANHRVPLLWRFHRAHHTDTHLDVTTALRFHPGELLFSGLAKAVWIAIWGPSLWGFAAFEVMISAAAQYHHSNIDFPDAVEGPIRLINVTPRMHASHHSALTRSLNANYSTILSVWDRIFGTYIPPTAEHLTMQGLPYGRDRDLDPRYFFVLPFQSAPSAEAAPAA